MDNSTVENNVVAVPKSKNYISGKVRDRFEIGYDLMCFHHSDRLSSFDRHIL